MKTIFKQIYQFHRLWDENNIKIIYYNQYNEIIINKIINHYCWSINPNETIYLFYYFSSSHRIFLNLEFNKQPALFRIVDLYYLKLIYIQNIKDILNINTFIPNINMYNKKTLYNEYLNFLNLAGSKYLLQRL